MADAAEATRILVVDDESEMAEMIAEDLSERGYAATGLTSGVEAARRLRTGRFDALITDLRMPGVDGLALLRVSLELDPSRPVILMTAYGAFDTAVRASGGGAYHYLTKPFRLDVLSRLIEQALGRS